MCIVYTFRERVSFAAADAEKVIRGRRTAYLLASLSNSGPHMLHNRDRGDFPVSQTGQKMRLPEGWFRILKIEWVQEDVLLHEHYLTIPYTNKSYKTWPVTIPSY